MAWLDVRFYSDTLSQATSMQVLLPQQSSTMIGMQSAAATSDDHPVAHPVLYLLHGRTDDDTIWLRRTSVERYVAPLGLAVVMPDVHLSYYTDMVCGGQYWRYVSEELPRLCHQFFRLSQRREDTFVAGLSMGGYGAFKLAMRQPERFAAAASLSGALDVTHFIAGQSPQWREQMSHVFPSVEHFTGSDDDLFAVADRLVDSGRELPRLYACCGTGDFIYEHSTAFRDHAGKIGLPLDYEEHDGRAHEWGYWDEQIKRVLQWLPLRRPGAPVSWR